MTQEEGAPGWVAELSELELTEWGERIGREATPPLVLDLRGDLGVGKTTLARAVGRGAGVRSTMPSPTYNLLFRYDASAGRELVHTDLYRLTDEEEVWALGWAELPASNQILLIEWGERATTFLPSPRWEIRIDEAGVANTRRVELIPRGGPPMIPLPGREAP